ncbi:MAG: helix-turn-helix transcriptional regulator [Erysipelotrichaceae bacterium]|jgi:transcriptional regulator with XRE-family HTH domain|nr:helix-turn-helix transcriptional regulator [Erysipelotrichaceae bacterium]
MNDIKFMKHINGRTLEFSQLDYKHDNYHALIVSGITMGRRIAAARLAKNMSKSELSRRIGTVYLRIHEWETDKKRPSDQYLSKLAEVLEVTTDWLARGVYIDEPRYLYDRDSLDIDMISTEEFSERNKKLITAGEILSSLSAETLDKVTTLIRRLYYIDYMKKISTETPDEDYIPEPLIDLYYESDKENEALKEARDYINDRIDSFEGSVFVIED